MARTSIGAAMKTMISAWMMAMRSMLTPAATCICRPPACERAEEEAGEEHADRVRAAEQRHGDRVEADAAGEVGRGAAEHAEHLVGAGEAGERAGERHHHDDDQPGAHAGIARRVGIERRSARNSKPSVVRNRSQ